MLRVQEHEGLCEGSFEGFECRWQAVPSFNDHKLALLVAAVSADAGVNLASYRQVSDKIAEIYGDIASYHPLRAEQMRLSFSPRELGHEWRVRSSRLGPWGRIKYFVRIALLNLAGLYLFARTMDTRNVRWSNYIDEMVENSDVRKFDGMLRMVMDGTEAQYRDLRSYLEAQYREGRLVYGMYKSSEAYSPTTETMCTLSTAAMAVMRWLHAASRRSSNRSEPEVLGTGGIDGGLRRLSPGHAAAPPGFPKNISRSFFAPITRASSCIAQ